MDSWFVANVRDLPWVTNDAMGDSMARAHQYTASAEHTASTMFTRWNTHGAPPPATHCRENSVITSGR